MTNPGDDDSTKQVVDTAIGYLSSAALRAVTLLGVAERLADGPRDPVQLAELTGANGPQLRRLLRFLATRGVFREDEDGRFQLTPLADVLRADAAGSMRAFVLGITAELAWLPTANLAE